MTSLTIDVTQEDIDRGKRRLTQWCPIALAMKRLDPDKFEDVRVTERYAYVHSTQEAWWLPRTT